MNRKKFFCYTCVILFSLIGVLTSCSVDQADKNGLEGLWNVKQTTDQSTSIGYDVRIERSKTDSSIFYIWNFMNLAGNVSTTKTQCRLVTKFIKGEIKTVQQVLYKTINDSTTIITGNGTIESGAKKIKLTYSYSNPREANGNVQSANAVFEKIEQ